jgi:hypothetical protein
MILSYPILQQFGNFGQYAKFWNIFLKYSRNFLNFFIMQTKTSEHASYARNKVIKIRDTRKKSRINHYVYHYILVTNDTYD